MNKQRGNRMLPRRAQNEDSPRVISGGCRRSRFAQDLRDVHVTRAV
jgi:hypothetical protein